MNQVKAECMFGFMVSHRYQWNVATTHVTFIQVLKEIISGNKPNVE